MPKVTLNKSTKINGKFVLAGEADVTAEQKKQLEKDNFLGESKKSNTPTNEKEIKALVAKVAALETKLEKAGGGEDNEALTAEIETLKAEATIKDESITSKDNEIEALKVVSLDSDELLKEKNDEIETLKADLEKAIKAPAKK